MISPNTIYCAPCPALLERMANCSIAMAYVDLPHPLQVEAALRRTRIRKGPDIAQAAAEEFSGLVHQIHRVLTQTGTLFIWLKTAYTSEYLAALEAAFGKDNFQAEIVIPKAHMGYHSKTFPPRSHDTVLFFGKTSTSTYNEIRKPLSPEDVRRMYPHEDARGLYRQVSLITSIVSMQRRYEWHGISLPPGRAWRFTKEEMERLDVEGRILFGRYNNFPRLKQYLADRNGVDTSIDVSLG